MYNIFLQKVIILLFLFFVSWYNVFWASWELVIDGANEIEIKNQEEVKGDVLKEWNEIKSEEKEIPKEEKPQTVKEMQSEIKTLEKEKEILEFKWNTFRIWNENLGDIIRWEMTPDDKSKLETLLVNYTSLKNKIDTDIANAVERGQETGGLQIELSELKRSLYMKLIPYIEEGKIGAFKLYIESDINYNEKSKEVATEIEEKEVERNERVEKIKDDIEENAEVLREQIRVKITTGLQVKLDEFIAQEKFQWLRDESKILLFERLISKLQTKKESLEDTVNPTSIIEERIFLYEVVQETLYWYIQNWKQ